MPSEMLAARRAIDPAQFSNAVGAEAAPLTPFNTVAARCS
jgi:hypothetical protein